VLTCSLRLSQTKRRLDVCAASALATAVSAGTSVWVLLCLASCESRSRCHAFAFNMLSLPGLWVQRCWLMVAALTSAAVLCCPGARDASGLELEQTCLGLRGAVLLLHKAMSHPQG
jgi:hypothetical protein